MRYLIAVMFIGVMGSLLTRPPSKISDPSASTHIVPAVAESSDEGVTGMPAAEMNLDGAIRLQRSSDGHFYADVELNGTTVTMLVDTGASVIALSREDARKAGIATSIGMNDVVGRGADGSVHRRVRHHRPGRARREERRANAGDGPQQRGTVASGPELPPEVRFRRDPRRHDDAPLSGLSWSKRAASPAFPDDPQGQRHRSCIRPFDGPWF